MDIGDKIKVKMFYQHKSAEGDVTNNKKLDVIKIYSTDLSKIIRCILYNSASSERHPFAGRICSALMNNT